MARRSQTIAWRFARECFPGATLIRLEGDYDGCEQLQLRHYAMAGVDLVTVHSTGLTESRSTPTGSESI